MKIGIITFHNSNNYGAVLQAVALQNKLIKLGHDVKIIDYICENKKDWYKVWRWDKANSLKYNLRLILDIPFTIKKNKKINIFTKNYYKLTEKRFFSCEEIEKYNLNYDIYICGSDQIWNYSNTNFDKAYFLDFEKVSEKKVSYAASFGISNIEQKYYDEYKRLLSGIYHLSVREESGKEIINKILDKEVRVVLDPTLLLNKNEWLEISDYKKIRYKYILVYTLHNSSSIENIAKKLSGITGYKIIKISSGSKDIFKKYRKIIASPNEFISLINNAEYIVTDSFHGTVFSLNLNKEFFVYLGKGINNHSRIVDMLNKCNTSNRIVYNDNEFELKEKINYKKVNKILENEREKSIEFLKKSISKEGIN